MASSRTGKHRKPDTPKPGSTAAAISTAETEAFPAPKPSMPLAAPAEEPHEPTMTGMFDLPRISPKQPEPPVYPPFPPMGNHPPQVLPAHMGVTPPPAPTPPPPPAPEPKQDWLMSKSASRFQLILAITAAFLIGGGVGYGLQPTEPPARDHLSVSAQPTPTATAEKAEKAEKPTPKPKPKPHKPTAKDFKIDVIILKQDCFGQAGCNITFRLDPKYIGPQLPAGKTYTVTLEIKEATDRKVASFGMNSDGDIDGILDSDMVSTAPGVTKLTAEVIQVLTA